MNNTPLQNIIGTIRDLMIQSGIQERNLINAGRDLDAIFFKAEKETYAEVISKIKERLPEEKEVIVNAWKAGANPLEQSLNGERYFNNTFNKQEPTK